MTRKTIYRTLLATLLLPNFTAYWWMLPKRMKRIRTQAQLAHCLLRQKFAKRMAEESGTPPRDMAAHAGASLRSRRSQIGISVFHFR